MATTSIRWQDRVQRHYDKVHDILKTNAEEVIRKATHSAESEAGKNVVDLHTKIGGIEVHRDILMDIQRVEDADLEQGQRMTIKLQWKSAEADFLFPTMDAELVVFPIKQATQLDFRGEYEPPMGIVGRTIDGIMGEKIAGDCVKHFISEIIAYLHETIEPDQE